MFNIQRCYPSDHRGLLTAVVPSRFMTVCRLINIHCGLLLSKSKKDRLLNIENIFNITPNFFY